ISSVTRPYGPPPADLRAVVIADCGANTREPSYWARHHIAIKITGRLMAHSQTTDPADLPTRPLDSVVHLPLVTNIGPYITYYPFASDPHEATANAAVANKFVNPSYPYVALHVAALAVTSRSVQASCRDTPQGPVSPWARRPQSHSKPRSPSH